MNALNDVQPDAAGAAAAAAAAADQVIQSLKTISYHTQKHYSFMFAAETITRSPDRSKSTVGDHGAGTATSGRIVKLTYLTPGNDMNEEGSSIIKEVSIDYNHRMALEQIGKMRFDTRFIRNVFFITNVVRILRLKLNRELTQSRNVLVSSHMSVAAGVTEYGSDPFGPNEVYDSKSLNRESRYDDGMPL